MIQLLSSKFGSQVYGTAQPNSDVDIAKVYLEPTCYIFGIQEAPSLHQKIDGEQDIREYYLRRFIRLCVAGNPNTLELLYTPPEHILDIHPTFELLYNDNDKELLLNKSNIVNAHLGFAKSQIMKMRQHEREMGAKRKELCRKYGYDVKFATHALRLTYQLRDLLTLGRIQFPYATDQLKILRSIRGGEVELTAFDDIYAKAVEGIDQLIAESNIIGDITNHDAITELIQRVYIAFYT